jgi:hypothetical protein
MKRNTTSPMNDSSTSIIEEYTDDSGVSTAVVPEKDHFPCMYFIVKFQGFSSKSILKRENRLFSSSVHRLDSAALINVVHPNHWTFGTIKSSFSLNGLHFRHALALAVVAHFAFGGSGLFNFGFQPCFLYLAVF